MEQTAEYIRVCYDAVAREYADRFAGELTHKPRPNVELGIVRFAVSLSYLKR